MAILQDSYSGSFDNNQIVYVSVYRTQSWTVNITGYDIYSIIIPVKRIGTCTSVTLNLYANSGDLPTGGVLATCTLDCSAWSTSYEEHEFVFDTPYTLTPSTKYVFQLSSNGVNSDNGLYLPAMNPGGYTDGQAGYWINGIGYSTDATRDFSFETYSEDGEGAVTGFMSPNKGFWGN